MNFGKLSVQPTDLRDDSNVVVTGQEKTKETATNTPINRADHTVLVDLLWSGRGIGSA
jgi:pyrimidine operon attenuation protein/uracil phosphoribosyltransferase